LHINLEMATEHFTFYSNGIKYDNKIRIAASLLYFFMTLFNAFNCKWGQNHKSNKGINEIKNED